MKGVLCKNPGSERECVLGSVQGPHPLKRTGCSRKEAVGDGLCFQ